MANEKNFKPQYVVQKLEGTRKHIVSKIDTKNKDGGFIQKEVNEPAGYMVFFPNGSSIRVRTDEELRRLGFDSPALLIDMDSGDTVGLVPENMSFRSMTEHLPGSVKETSITETATNGEE